MADEFATGLPPLERGTVHVFWFGTDLSASRLDLLERLLDSAERARAHRFQFARDRGRFIAARGQLRTLLGHYSDRAPTRIEFDTGPHGKPRLRHANGAALVQFNLSRSHGLGVVAIGLEAELGIDVERIRPFDDALAIAERMFADEEHRAIRDLPVGAQPEAFFWYWTRKEAVVKSLGWGLSHPLDGFALAPDGRSPERIELDCQEVHRAVWVLPVPPLRERCVAALATTGPPPMVHCWEWHGD